MTGLATRFVDLDHDTVLCLPPDLRDWVPANHLVHFPIDAVEPLVANAEQADATPVQQVVCNQPFPSR